jgi:hypothetical protein
MGWHGRGARWRSRTPARLALLGGQGDARPRPAGRPSSVDSGRGALPSEVGGPLRAMRAPGWIAVSTPETASSAWSTTAPTTRSRARGRRFPALRPAGLLDRHQSRCSTTRLGRAGRPVGDARPRRRPGQPPQRHAHARRVRVRGRRTGRRFDRRGPLGRAGPRRARSRRGPAGPGDRRRAAHRVLDRARAVGGATVPCGRPRRRGRSGAVRLRIGGWAGRRADPATLDPAAAAVCGPRLSSRMVALSGPTATRASPSTRTRARSGRRAGPVARVPGRGRSVGVRPGRAARRRPEPSGRPTVGGRGRWRRTVERSGRSGPMASTRQRTS